MTTPNGTVPALAPPAVTATPRMDRVPGLGEDTRAVLRGLDLDEDQIRALEEDGVV